MAGEPCGNELSYTLSGDARPGDHVWRISDVSRLRRCYPAREYRYDVRKITE